MQTQEKMETETLIVPIDVFMDVLKILFKNKLSYKIEGLNEHQNILLMKVVYNPEQGFSKSAIKNIKSMLSDYTYYLKGSTNSSEWISEDEDDD